MGDQDPESQQELFSRLGCDAPAPALLAAIRVGWAHTRRAAAAAFANVQEWDAHPSTPLGGGGAVLYPPCTSMFIALAGSELPQSTETTLAPPPPVPSNDLFLSPTFVQSLATELAVDPVFGPILRCAATAHGRLVDRRGAPIR